MLISLQWPLGLVILCLLFPAGSMWAQEVTDSACGGTQSIYFGNGVWAISEQDEQERFEVLKKLLRNLMAPEEYLAIKFGLAFNRSVHPISDLIEAAGQILGTEYPSLLIGRFLGISHLQQFFIPDPLQQQLNDVLRNEAARRLIQSLTSEVGEQDVKEHVENYKADIVHGRKIVVVAHSQGNIFVNLAFEQLARELTSEELNSFAMVPVASPDSVARRTLVEHVTFSNDLVIDAVQVVRTAAGLEPALPPTDFLENPLTLFSTAGHDFSLAYLADDSSRELILNGVITSLASLPSPPIIGQPGIITVTLTWGQQPDVDLHVFEPDDSHVYYANLQGSVGYLDVDDTDGEGPEHYFASCADLLESPASLGTYQVGVNYYRGDAPETASITVEAPGVTRPFDMILPAALGTSGNLTPIPVANIVVTQNSQTGLLEFTVTTP